MQQADGPSSAWLSLTLSYFLHSSLFVATLVANSSSKLSPSSLRNYQLCTNQRAPYPLSNPRMCCIFREARKENEKPEV